MHFGSSLKKCAHNGFTSFLGLLRSCDITDALLLCSEPTQDPVDLIFSQPQKILVGCCILKPIFP